MTENEILEIISRHTGQSFVFAVGTVRKWGSEDAPVEQGTFYQLMPSDGEHEFFDWYCQEQMYRQWHIDKASCALAFLDNFIVWYFPAS